MTQTGTKLTFENFTIGSVPKGPGLTGAARQTLKFAQEQGAKTLQFTGKFTNHDLAKRFGTTQVQPSNSRLRRPPREYSTIEEV